MSDEDFTPLREWDIELETTVLDRRRDTEGAKGTVVRCTLYGHFADPYWRASVLWEDSGYIEHDINTVWLTREDGSQGRR